MKRQRNIDEHLAHLIYDEAEVQAIKVKLGKEILEGRKKLGISADTLGKLAGIEEYTVFNIEKNRSNYAIESYLKCKNVIEKHN